MTLNIGENLKIYRAKKRITQEQLAYEFGVSPQAVSRWETGATYPDITLLPVIANYFGITVDELLGVVKKCPQAEKDSYQEKSLSFRHDGKTSEALALDREMLEKYPSDEDALYNLMYQLYTLKLNEPTTEYDSEIISTANMLVSTSKREYITSGAKQVLIYMYSRCREFDKAKEVAETLSSMYCSKDILYPEAFEGEDEIKLHQYNILSFADLLFNTFLPISSYEKDLDKKIEIYTVSNTVITSLLGENPAFYNGRLSWNHCAMACIFAEKNDSDKAMEHLRLALKYAENFEFRPEKSRYSPCWLNLVDDIKSESTKSDEDSCFDEIHDWLENESFDFMRSTDEFKSFADEVKELSDKLKKT